MTKLVWLKTAVAAVVATLMLTLTPLALAADAVHNTTQQISMLDINSADAVAIAEALEGVGMVKAQEIVAYRELFGNFHSIEELVEVQGIGDATVERNRGRIIIVNK
ncbi:MAG: competence protein ComEA [SAR86 cluster bacterium]|uniref:Competence protein ComEA n=1 Tax=SAR86 cluster bacterium TaxID=2030880 RepID=A0A2A5BAC8_9GAMM|nr:MAG: competence protein ComEA [SAR86 cluster bacterium]